VGRDWRVLSSRVRTQPQPEGWGMAKENPNTKPKATTPFRKFEQLAKKIVRVPKEKVNKRDLKLS